MGAGLTVLCITSKLLEAFLFSYMRSTQWKEDRNTNHFHMDAKKSMAKDLQNKLFLHKLRYTCNSNMSNINENLYLYWIIPSSLEASC